MSHFVKGLFKLFLPAELARAAARRPLAAAAPEQGQPRQGGPQNAEDGHRRFSYSYLPPRRRSSSRSLSRALPPSVRRALRLRRAGAPAAPAPQATRWASKRTQTDSAIYEEALRGVSPHGCLANEHLESPRAVPSALLEFSIIITRRALGGRRRTVRCAAPCRVFGQRRGRRGGCVHPNRVNRLPDSPFPHKVHIVFASEAMS